MSFFERSFEETIGSSCTDLGGAGRAPDNLSAYMNMCGVEVNAGNNVEPAPVAPANNEWSSLLKSKPSSPGMGS